MHRHVMSDGSTSLLGWRSSRSFGRSFRRRLSRSAHRRFGRSLSRSSFTLGSRSGIGRSGFAFGSRSGISRSGFAFGSRSGVSRSFRRCRVGGFACRLLIHVEVGSDRQDDDRDKEKQTSPIHTSLHLWPSWWPSVPSSRAGQRTCLAGLLKQPWPPDTQDHSHVLARLVSDFNQFAKREQAERWSQSRAFCRTPRRLAKQGIWLFRLCTATTQGLGSLTLFDECRGRNQGVRTRSVVALPVDARARGTQLRFAIGSVKQTLVPIPGSLSMVSLPP